MEQSVIISIQGDQKDPVGEIEKIELVTTGQLTKAENGSLHLTYEESQLTGLEGTTTTFQVSADQIIMVRKGTLNAEMIFREGERHMSLYDTAYGGLMIGINTQRAKANISQTGGTLELQYNIEAENAVVSENTFLIEVRPAASV